MPANVETMFSVRETPWHGLGTALAVSLWMPLQAVKPWSWLVWIGRWKAATSIPARVL